jgi:hypothetical protein
MTTISSLLRASLILFTSGALLGILYPGIYTLIKQTTVGQQLRNDSNTVNETHIILPASPSTYLMNTNDDEWCAPTGPIEGYEIVAYSYDGHRCIGVPTAPDRDVNFTEQKTNIPILSMSFYGGWEIDHGYEWTPGLIGIAIVYADEVEPHIIGQSCHSGDPCSLIQTVTFQPSEYLIGDLSIGCWPWPLYFYPCWVGGMSFRTNLQAVNIGIIDTNRPIRVFNADHSKIMGFYGKMIYGKMVDGYDGTILYQGWLIDQFGVYLSKPLKSMTIGDVSYPTLSTITAGLSPAVLSDFWGCDDTPDDISITKTFTQTTGNNYCWMQTISDNWGMGASFSISGKVPIIGWSMSSNYHWTESNSDTTSNNTCTQQSTTEGTSTMLRVPAEYICHYTITQWASQLPSIPYNASGTYYFWDGTNYTFDMFGDYSGTYVETYNISADCTPLNGTKCNSRGPEPPECMVDTSAVQQFIQSTCGIGGGVIALATLETATCELVAPTPWSPGMPFQVETSCDSNQIACMAVSQLDILSWRIQNCILLDVTKTHGTTF